MRVYLSAIITAIVAAHLMILPAHAQTPTYPNRLITLVVAYAPGATGDVVARMIASRLGPALGQTVIVENRAGASGAIGTQYVTRSPADGYNHSLFGMKA